MWTYVSPNCPLGSSQFYRPVVVSHLQGSPEVMEGYLDAFFEIGEMISQRGGGLSNKETKKGQSEQGESIRPSAAQMHGELAVILGNETRRLRETVGGGPGAIARPSRGSWQLIVNKASSKQWTM